MGVADLGGPSGVEPGTFTTAEFQGTVGVGADSTYNASLGGSAASMSFQLNAFVVFSVGEDRYAYWVQDVAIFDTADRAVSFEDNVWNVTKISLNSHGVSGNGSIEGSGDSQFYGVSAPCSLPGACVTLSDPASIVFTERASLNRSGSPVVRVAFDDAGTTAIFDTITFPFASGLTSPPLFDVDPGLGFPGTCPRCFGDAEMVAGGPGNGAKTTLDGATSLTFSLDWWNGYNFQAVPDASNYGEATEEGLSDAVDVLGANATDQPVGELTYGASGSLSTLWTPSSASTVEVSDRTSTPSGTLSVAGGSVPFADGFVELVLVPGSVPIDAIVAATTYPLGTHALAGGTALTLEFGYPAVTFVPNGLPTTTIWSVTLGSQALSGTGNLTFGEPTGAYTYTVGGVSNYRASPGSGAVTVGTSGATVTISWSSTNTGWIASLTSLFHQYELEWIVLFFVIVVVGIAAAASSRGPPSTRRPVRPPVREFATLCPQCAGPIPYGTVVCPRCGYYLGGPPPPPRMPPQPPGSIAR